MDRYSTRTCRAPRGPTSASAIPLPTHARSVPAKQRI